MKAVVAMSTIGWAGVIKLSKITIGETINIVRIRMKDAITPVAMAFEVVW